MKRKEPKAPKTLSGAIEIGIKDLRSAVRRKGIVLDMGVWFSTDAECRVCFAGAVMLGTFELLQDHERLKPYETTPGHYDAAPDLAGEDWQRVFYALDTIRYGNARQAAEEMCLQNLCDEMRLDAKAWEMVCKERPAHKLKTAADVREFTGELEKILPALKKLERRTKKIHGSL